MSTDDHTLTIELRQQSDYAFEIDFGGGLAALQTDEPPPLGAGTGPTPVQLLAAAVGQCLSNSLLFALRKFRQSPEPLRTTATARVGRNAEGRLRVLGIDVELRLGVPATALQHLDRVLSTFEAYCTVTRSVGQGIPVGTTVRDSTGAVLKG